MRFRIFYSENRINCGYIELVLRERSDWWWLRNSCTGKEDPIPPSEGRYESKKVYEADCIKEVIEDEANV